MVDVIVTDGVAPTVPVGVIVGETVTVGLIDTVGVTL